MAAHGDRPRCPFGPVHIPFVPTLYHALTGDQLTVFDLTCLLAAVPGTILLEVLTGKPTVPGTVTAGPGAATPAPEIAAASCWAWPVS